MRSLRFFIGLFLSSITCASALAQTLRGGENSGADSSSPEWIALETRAKTLDDTPALPGDATPEARKAKHDDLVVSLTALASDARTFYVQRGSDPKAVDARELEINCLVRVANRGGGEAGLKGAVANFRADATIPKERRARVAGLHEFTAVRRAHKPHEGLASAMEDAARGLLKEFSDQPQGYETLLTVARQSDDVRYRDILFELWQSPAPAAVKLQVRELLDRHFLVGDDLRTVFADAGTPSLSRALVKGRPTVIYFWSVDSASSLDLAALLATRESEGFTLIGVNIDSGLAKEQRTAKSKSLPGTQHSEARGRGGLLATRLKIRTAPAVVLADGAGKIVDTRGEWDIAAKLDRLNR